MRAAKPPDRTASDPTIGGPTPPPRGTAARGVWRPGGLQLLPMEPSNAWMATGARCNWSCAATVDSELGLHIAAFAWPAYNSTNLRSRAHIKRVACQRWNADICVCTCSTLTAQRLQKPRRCCARAVSVSDCSTGRAPTCGHGEQRALETCQTKLVPWVSYIPEPRRGTAAKVAIAQEFGSNLAQCGCGLAWESDAEARRGRVSPSLKPCLCTPGTRLGHAYECRQMPSQPLFVSRADLGPEYRYVWIRVDRDLAFDHMHVATRERMNGWVQHQRHHLRTQMAPKRLARLYWRPSSSFQLSATPRGLVVLEHRAR
jgi:hypothetical protein